MHWRAQVTLARESTGREKWRNVKLRGHTQQACASIVRLWYFWLKRPFFCRGSPSLRRIQYFIFDLYINKTDQKNQNQPIK
jgi:hypothetical protein